MSYLKATTTALWLAERTTVTNEALIDSGAQRSVVGRLLADIVGAPVVSIPPPASGAGDTTISGEHRRIRLLVDVLDDRSDGVQSCDVELVVLVPDEPADSVEILLGADFLQAAHARIDFETDEVAFRSGRWRGRRAQPQPIDPVQRRNGWRGRHR